MRTTLKAMAFATAGLLWGTTASAQQPAAYEVYPDEAYQSDAQPVDYYAYESYYAGTAQEPSPAAPAPAEESAPPAAAYDGGCCDLDCGDQSCCDLACCDDCGPFAIADLFPRLKCWDITVAGWTAQSFTWNTERPADRFNGPMTFNDRSNEYQLNQQYLYVERLANNCGEGLALGFRIDSLYGTDHRFTTATGLETFGDGRPDWNRGHRFYGLALPQFYGEVAYNDLKLKIGHWYTPVGYEGVMAAYVFFASHPYTHQYGEPFTHTGLMGTYQWTDNVALISGLTRGWDNFDNRGNPHLGYLGGWTYTGENGGSIAYVHHYSRQLNQLGRFTGRYVQSLVLSKQFNDRLSVVLQSDLGTQSSALARGGPAWWYGVNKYVFYKINECWTWGIRSEWFRDDGGFRVGGFLPTLPDGRLRGLPVARSGFDGSFYEITIGPNYHWNKNLVIRPSWRLDWYDGPLNNAGLRPYDDGTKRHQFTWATEVLFTY